MRGVFFDVCRLATSHFLAARDSGLPLDKAVQVPLAGLLTYTDTVRRLLKKGKEPQFAVTFRTADREHTKYPPHVVPFRDGGGNRGIAQQQQYQACVFIQ